MAGISGRIGRWCLAGRGGFGGLGGGGGSQLPARMAAFVLDGEPLPDPPPPAEEEEEDD